MPIHKKDHKQECEHNDKSDSEDRICSIVSHGFASIGALEPLRP
jgi:hypothetical protein